MSEVKKTEQEAHYKIIGKRSRRRCELCSSYLGGEFRVGFCEKVYGNVQELGTCDEFSKKEDEQ